MNRLFTFLFCLIATVLPKVTSAQIQLTPLVKAANTSLRGLSVVNASVIWVSGSKGYVGKSLNAGKTWEWTRPKGYEAFDFRDIHAFDEKKAVIVNAGSPAYILSTVDGGKTWRENYKNLDSAIFLDGMDFWDHQNGMVFGDPIDHRMQLLRTQDGGLTWQNVSAHLKKELKVGEAGFAASGTSIKAADHGKVWIATGGSVSNVYYSSNYGNNWKVYKCPIIQGETSTGAFSIDFFDAKNGIVVGGNYLKDKDHQNNVLYTLNGGKTWRKSKMPVTGYRSGVTYLSKDICIATGTSGTDVSKDGGKNWQNVSSLSFNAVRAFGNKAILVGGNGQIYQLSVGN